MQCLEEYDIVLNYVPGSENVVADVLSRSIQSSSSPETVSFCSATVPEKEVGEVIRRYHEYGHLGVHKTRSCILQANLWFPNMLSKIRKYINNCLVCATNKSYGSQCVKGSLPKTEVQPFEAVSIDIVGPLKTSINNHMSL